MVKAILYVLYYNDETKERVLNEYGSNPICRPLFVPTTVFYENFVIFELLLHHMEEWSTCDYVGILSYKARDKCYIPYDFQRLEAAKREQYQIIYFHGSTVVENYLRSAYRDHKNAYDIFHLLAPLISCDLHKNVPIWCNYWFMTPSVLFKYILYLRYVKTIFETNSEIKKLVWEDSGWNITETFKEYTGLSYVPHHPFIMERLTGLFAIDFKTIQYYDLPTT